MICDYWVQAFDVNDLIQLTQLQFYYKNEVIKLELELKILKLINSKK